MDTNYFNNAFLKAFVWRLLPWIQRLNLTHAVQGRILLLLMRILIKRQKVNKGQLIDLSF